MEEGTNYLYTGNPEPLMVADKLVPKFKIFAKHLNRIEESTVKKPMAEEFVLTLELEMDIPAMEQKDASDHKRSATSNHT